MKKNFKTGDRVAADHDTTSKLIRVKGIFVQIDQNGFAVVEKPGSGCAWLCSPKSMRRLVKKDRLRVWINLYPHGLNSTQHTSKKLADGSAMPSRIRCVEFVEVRGK
ncbi:MAG: hypothetical protein V4568_14565 [Pseudomonadota bacterium]